MAVLAYDVLTIDEVRISDYMREQGVWVDFLHYDGSGPVRVESPVLNRLLSRAYRLKLGRVLELSGVPAINPWTMIRNSDLKPRSKLLFQKANLPTPQSILLEESFFVWDGGSLTLNEPRLGQMLEAIDGFGYPIVIKPTRGSRGLSVLDFENRRGLVESLFTILAGHLSHPGDHVVPVAFYQNLQNAGTFVERREPHALDLRVPVARFRGCQARVLGCLARLGRDELQLAKNTALGAIPIGVEPAPEIRELCIRAAESVAAGAPAYVVGVDILPAQPDINERQKVYRRVSYIVEAHRMVREQARKAEEVLRGLQQSGRSTESILRDPRVHREIEKMDALFQYFGELCRTYDVVEAVEEYLAHARLLVTEVNTRPDFGINTHNLATDLLPEAYLRALTSLEG